MSAVSHSMLYGGGAAIVVLLLIAGAAMLLVEAHEEDLVRRVRALSRGAEAKHVTSARLAAAALDLLRRIGDRLRRTALMSPAEIAEFERMLASAGLNARSSIGALLGAKIVLPILLAVVAYAVAESRGFTTVKMLMAVGAALPIGMLLPNWCVGKLQKRYHKALERGIPDALDLIVICAEAGLGLETAIERVSVETRLTNRAVSLEFSLLDQELRMLSDRRKALTNFAERAALDVMKRLSANIIQTIEFGSPLGKGLRILAAELRQERLIRLEEKAGQLPTLLVMPMILFILPCLFIVLLGPAVVKIMAALGGLQ